ncbi:MAG: I78 family peptidase inhibitor [Streptomyces sp.]|uniref:I78 family peptidase inhibitor n=1 Tax=Streptomyces sp. TaxID=1931 RepID=UPI003D6C45F6
MAPESAPQDNPQDEPESYVGLSAGAAEERARERGWTTVRTLAPNAIITMEYLTGRLNFAVDESTGTVVRCWPG